MCSALPRRWKATFLCTVVLSLITACASRHTAPSSASIGSRAPAGGPAVAESANPFGGCDMCHIDVADEVAGTRHHAKGVNCVKCHGASQGHVRDENNEVKPDRVFGREHIDPFCGTCHTCSRPEAKKRPIRPKPDHKVCTDCHGVHRIVRGARVGRTPNTS